MKKVFQYVRSMRFGILLLVLVTVLSVIGTVIPQGKEISWYAQTYKSFHGVILMLKLNAVFQSWYFRLLMVLLGLNLTLCSLVRVRSVAKARAAETDLLLKAPDRFALDEAQRKTVRDGLLAMHCREEEAENGVRIYRKNGFGRYGSFLTHLSILLTLIFGAAALYLPQITDKTCLPGEALTMDDGTEIHVHDFRIADKTGRLDFQSHVQITLPSGRRSEIAELKVNHPFSFGSWKLFQQTFDGLFICLHQRDKRQNQREDRFLQFSVSLHQQLIDIFILTLLDGHTIFLELLNQLFFYGSVSEVCTLGLYQNRSIFFVRSPLPVDAFKITFVGSKPTALRSLSKPTWHITPVVDGKMLQIQPFPFTCSILIIDCEIRSVLLPFRCSGIMLV